MPIAFDPDKDEINIAKHGCRSPIHARSTRSLSCGSMVDPMMAKRAIRRSVGSTARRIALAFTFTEEGYALYVFAGHMSRSYAVMDRPDPAPSFDADPDFDDNPEWSDEDLAKARPASEVLPPHIVAQLVRSGDDQRMTVTLELDADVIAKFRAIGPERQTRVDEVLRAAEPPDGVHSHAARTEIG